MMPHEYEREIKNLKIKVEYLEELEDVTNARLDSIQDFLEKIAEDVIKLKGEHGQKNTQDTKRPEESNKRHKPVAKDG